MPRRWYGSRCYDKEYRSSEGEAPEGQGILSPTKVPVELMKAPMLRTIPAVAPYGLDTTATTNVTTIDGAAHALVYKKAHRSSGPPRLGELRLRELTIIGRLNSDRAQKTS